MNNSNDANRGFFIPDEADNYGRFSKTTHGRKPLVGIVYSDDDDDDEEEIKYCPNCEKYNGKNRLGHRIVKEGEPALPENDMENFLQCYVCGKVFAVHEIEKQKNLKVSELKGHVTDNPFEAGQTLLESVPTRTSPAGRKATAKRRRERDRPHHKDKEIDEEMRKHGDRVTVLEDTDP